MKRLLMFPFSPAIEHGEQEQSSFKLWHSTNFRMLQRFISGFPDYINYKATITQLMALSKMILVTQLLHFVSFWLKHIKYLPVQKCVYLEKQLLLLLSWEKKKKLTTYNGTILSLQLKYKTEFTLLKSILRNFFWNTGITYKFLDLKLMYHDVPSSHCSIKNSWEMQYYRHHFTP